MTVSEADRVDFMSKDEKTGTFWLNMVEDREWADLDPAFKDLERKVNFYIGIIRSGELEEQVPQSRGSAVGIRLMCQGTPSPEGLHILSLTKAGCLHFDIPFSVIDARGGDKREIAVEVGQISGIDESNDAPKKPKWKFWA